MSKNNKANKTTMLYKRRHCIKKLSEKKIFDIDGRKLTQCKNKTLFSEFKKLYNLDYHVYYDDRLVANKARKEAKLLENGYIYFFVNVQHNLCKIGYSNNPLKRINGVQTGCPFSLEIKGFFSGDKKLEKKLHRVFKEYNSNGEWFNIDGKLKEYIEYHFPKSYDSINQPI